ALFRAQLVAPLLDPLSEPEERTAWRRWVTTRPHTLPNGQTRRVSERTLRRWVAQARAVGYEGLKAAVRRDRGRLRKLRPEWIERAVALKREELRRSVPHILRMLRAEFGDAVQVNPGTLWRHLAREGLGGRPPHCPKPVCGAGKAAVWARSGRPTSSTVPIFPTPKTPSVYCKRIWWPSWTITP